MALTTYTELKSAIADWLNRTDLTTQIGDFVTLAEAKFGRDKRLDRERRDTFSLTAEVTTLPSDCREVRSLYFDDTIRYGSIEIVSPEMLAEKKTQYGDTGYPRFGAIATNGTEIVLAPAPDATYVTKIHYLTTLTALSATVSSNWILASHPDAYLFGALVAAEPFLKNDERLPVWKSQLEEALAEIGDLHRRRREMVNTPVIRPKRAIG